MLQGVCLRLGVSRCSWVSVWMVLCLYVWLAVSIHRLVCVCVVGGLLARLCVCMCVLVCGWMYVYVVGCLYV